MAPRSPWVPSHIFASAFGAAGSPFGGGSLSEWGYGLGLSVGVRWKPLPLVVGADLFVLHWDTNTERRTLRFSGRPVAAEVSRSDNTVFYDLWLRLFWPSERVRPYAEGIVGLKGLYTDYGISLAGSPDTLESKSSQTSATSFGFGAGLEVLIAKSAQVAAVYGVLGFRRLWGSRAAFDSVTPSALGEPTTTNVITLGIALHAELPRASSSPDKP